MAKIKTGAPKNSFNAGILSPSMYGRTDIDKWHNGARQMSNWIIHPQGGTSNRGGTKFIGKVYDSTVVGRIKSFQFSSEQGYFFDLGDQTMRIIKDDALIWGAGNGHDLVDTDKYVWFPSTDAANEWGLSRIASTSTGDDAISVPTSIFEDYLGVNTELTKNDGAGGGVGGLAAGEWDWGDNDSLGYDTVYVRLTDETDPDIHYQGFLRTDDRLELIDNNRFGWQLSVNGTNEYFLRRNLDPDISKPLIIYENADSITPIELTEGTIGSLVAGEWAYGEAEAISLVQAVDNPFQWTAHPAPQNDRYYLELNGGGDPMLIKPDEVLQNGIAMTDQPDGNALVDGEWFWGDSGGSLAFSTIVVDINRVAGGGDPDDEADGYLSLAAPGYNTIHIHLSDDSNPNSHSNGYLEMAGNVTPWLEADLPDLKFTPSLDTVYVEHPNYALRKISRLADDKWNIDTVSFGTSVDTPQNHAVSVSGTSNWHVITAVDANGNESKSTTPPLKTDNSGTITWDRVDGALQYNIYGNRSSETAPLGFVLTVEQSATPSIIGETLVDALIAGPDFNQAPPAGEDPFVGTDNYPAAGTFFEQRLVLAGSNNAPQMFRGSKTTQFEDYLAAKVPVDDDAYAYRLEANESNPIRWIISSENMIIGTLGAIWRVKHPANKNSITPTEAPDAKAQVKIGASKISPVEIGTTILFVSSNKNVIYDLGFSLEKDSLTENNRSILAEHLFYGRTIDGWCYQREPYSTIWGFLDNGSVFGLTYMPEHEVIGFHQHDYGGETESMDSLNQQDGFDSVTMINKRTINSNTVRYIEAMMPRIEPLTTGSQGESDISSSFFMDSGLQYDGAAATTFSGLLHLEGEDLAILADGVEVTDKTATEHSIVNSTYKWTQVGATAEYYLELAAGGDPLITTKPSNVFIGGSKATEGAVTGLNDGEWDWAQDPGSTFYTVYVKIDATATDPDDTVDDYITINALTLSSSASKVNIGLPITGIVETLDIEPQGSDGDIQRRDNQVSIVTFRLKDTANGSFEFGSQSDRLDTMTFGKPETDNVSNSLLVGDAKRNIKGSDYKHSRLYIKTTKPLPVTILALYPVLESNDG